MMTEQLVYRAHDWGRITTNLPPNEPFTHHLKGKAKAATDRFGPDHPFAETLAPAKALDIKKIAHLKDIQQVPETEETKP